MFSSLLYYYAFLHIQLYRMRYNSQILRPLTRLLPEQRPFIFIVADPWNWYNKGIQKCLTNKLINKDYHPSNGPLKMIEWFRLYPLKKLLLAFIWGFCAYQSVRGFRIVWIEKHQEVLWIELFFLCFTLLTAYKIWKYIKTPYHCAKFNTNVCQ